MARYVVTNTRRDDRQTFVCEGDMTLDAIFEHAAAREGGQRSAPTLAPSSAKRRVFKLVISQGELTAPMQE
jgi:hypothetical protein